MTTEIIKHEDWYNHLIDDCKSIIVEKTFESRWALIEGYHELGTRILEDYGNLEREKVYGEEIVRNLAISIGISSRVIYYAIQFARAYPDVGQVPGGKNISWNKICHELLPEKTDKDEARQDKDKASSPPKDTPSLSGLLKYKTYLEYVEAQPCILCGERPVDKAHFPTTKKMGGEDWQVIPLCRKCHEEFHIRGVDTFISSYKPKVFGYFYGLILKIWEKHD